MLLAKKLFQCSLFCFYIALWYFFKASFACCFSFSTIQPVQYQFFAQFLQWIYTQRSFIRSIIHYFFIYSEGLAFRVSIQTAFNTISISQSIYCCTLLPIRIIQKAVIILFLILFHSAFLKRILYSIACLGTVMLNIILIALQLDLYSILYTIYFTIVDASLFNIRIRLIIIL